MGSREADARHGRPGGRRLPDDGVERLQPARPALRRHARARARRRRRARVRRPGPGRALAAPRQAGTIGVVLTESLSYAFSDPGLVSFLRGSPTTSPPRAARCCSSRRRPSGAGDLVRGALVDAFVVCSHGRDRRGRRRPWARGGCRWSPWASPADGRPVARHRQRRVGRPRRRAPRRARPPPRGHRRGAGRDPGDTEGRTCPCAWGVRAVSTPSPGREAAPAAGSSSAMPDQHPRGGPAARPRAARSGLRPADRVFAVTECSRSGVRRGRRPGPHAGRLSVVGFDEIEAAHRATPPLTTIRRTCGQGAHRRPHRARPGRRREATGTAPSAELVVRESTAPPPRKAHA